MDTRSLVERQIAAHESATLEDFDRFGQLTLDERARMVDAACEVAVEQAAERRRLKIPSALPGPWPESTWMTLKRYAPNGRHDRAPESETDTDRCRTGEDS